MGAADVRHGDQGRGGRGRGKKTSSRNSARAHGLSLRTRSRMHLVIVHAPDVSCGSAAYATFAALVSGIWTRIMVGLGKGPAGSFDRRAKALVWPRNCWRDRAHADPGRWWARFALPTPRDPLLSGAVLGRPDAGHQIVGGVDQRHVGERLGEIAEKALCPRVVFLGQEA